LDFGKKAELKAAAEKPTASLVAVERNSGAAGRSGIKERMDRNRDSLKRQRMKAESSRRFMQTVGQRESHFDSRLKVTPRLDITSELASTSDVTRLTDEWPSR